MKTWCHKITAGIILVAIVAMIVLPGGTLFFPKKAEAQTSCISGIIMGFISKLIGGITTFMSVPIKNQPIQKNTSSTAGNTFGSWVSDCIIKPMVKALVKELIHEFLMSIVDWINNGFEDGGPRFISDVEGFFADVVDRGVGQMIYGSDLKWLCSPFALDIRLALGLNYWGPRFRDRIKCTLSDVINNTMNAAQRTAYRNSWQSWLDITTRPQNNPYGAFALAKSELEIRIANQQWVAGKEADWGSGFLTTKRCVANLPPEETSDDMFGNVLTNQEARCAKWETVTPGKLVQEGIGKVIGAEVDEYVAAEDIDAIFGALTNQMIGSIFGATGIFSGTTRNTNYYRNKFESDKTAGVFNVGSGGTAPAGFENFDCATIGNYVRNGEVVSVINGDTTTPVSGYPWTNRQDAPTPLTQSQVYSLLTKYCSEKGFWNTAQTAVNNNIPPAYGGESSKGEGTQINIALGGAGTDTAIATQSTTLNGFGPQFGNDGSTFGGANSMTFGIAATASYAEQYWEVDFSKTKFSRYIENIVITPAAYINRTGTDNSSAWNLLDGAIVDVYNGNTKVFSNTLPNFNGASPYRISLCAAGQTTCTQATRVKISGGANGLALAEVSVFSHPQPIIYSTGASTLNIAQGEDFIELDGVIAKDFNDKDIPQENIIADMNIDANTSDGIYIITYTATDSAGVPSNPLERIVTVGAGGAVVSGNGGNPITCQSGQHPEGGTCVINPPPNDPPAPGGSGGSGSDPSAPGDPSFSL